MKKIATALLGATLLSATANASDLFGGSTKDGPATTGPSASGGVVNFTGFYIGGQFGYGNANHNLSVRDYFKDYCASNGDDSVGFDDYDKWKTVENKKSEWPTITGDTCETLAKPQQFDAGSHFTVPGDSRELANIDGLNSHGFFGGGRLGYDHARGRLLFGVFADYNFTNMETDASIAGVGNFGLEKDDEWTIGGRVGYIVAPRTLAYILAGYTQTEYNVTGLDNALIAPQFTSTRGGAEFDGVTVGGGVEFAMTSNIFLGVEYQHTFYGEETLIDLYDANSNRGLRVLDDLDEDKVMATLKIKLNSGLFGGL